jgi:hypothetical protein
MDSALRPREIQSRIRAGQSLAEVARVAGVPVERIEAYALPVLAEREHVAGLALAATIRRRGESGVHRNLRPVIRERLTAHQIDPDTVTWDAWRNEDRRWTVTATWKDDQTHTATFLFDLRSRFSVAVDDEARWLISEGTPAPPAAAGESDQLALVRAVSPAPRPVESGDEPTVALRDTRLRAVTPMTPDTPHPDDSDDFLPRSSVTPLEIGEAVEAEIDNYGVIPDGRSELDVLYDMLGGIAEDSINIYAGLADPVVPESAGVPHWTAPAKPAADQPAATESAPPAPATTPKSPKSAGRDTPGETTSTSAQPKLTDDPEATLQLKPGASKRRRKGRAQVPSWEEIMFGSPKGDT